MKTRSLFVPALIVVLGAWIFLAGMYVGQRRVLSRIPRTASVQSDRIVPHPQTAPQVKPKVEPAPEEAKAPQAVTSKGLQGQQACRGLKRVRPWQGRRSRRQAARGG